MGLDKIKNAAEKTAGRAKKAVGKATGDERLQTRGQAAQGKADLENAMEKVKDAKKD